MKPPLTFRETIPMNTVILKKIHESGLPYVVISGYGERPDEPKNFDIQVLVERGSRDRLAKAIDAQEKSKLRNFCKYTVSTGNKQLFVYIYEKGNGVFPETFEAVLLKSRVMHNGICYVPDSDRNFWVVLYRMVVHEGRCHIHERRVIIEQLRKAMGGLMHSSYVHLGHHSEPIVQGQLLR